MCCIQVIAQYYQLMESLVTCDDNEQFQRAEHWNPSYLAWLGADLVTAPKKSWVSLVFEYVHFSILTLLNYRRALSCRTWFRVCGKHLSILVPCILSLNTHKSSLYHIWSALISRSLSLSLSLSRARALSLTPPLRKNAHLTIYTPNPKP